MISPVEAGDAYRRANADALLTVVVEAHLPRYASVFRRLEHAAEQDGASGDASLFNLLAAVAAAAVDPNDPAGSYEAFVIGPERRARPLELEQPEVEALAAVAEITGVVAFRARLRDVLWYARRRHEDCRLAIADYLTAGQTEAGSFVYRVSSLRRGLDLARRLGRRQPVFVDALNVVLERARHVAATTTTGFLACKLFELIEQQGGPAHCAEFAPLALARAEAARAVANHHEAEIYYLTAAKLQRKAGDRYGEQSTLVRNGDVLIERGEGFARADPADYMSAEHWMKRGIEQLQRSGATQERLTPLRIRLGVLQRLTIKGFARLELPPELAERVQAEHEENRVKVERALTGLSFQVAVLLLARMFPLASVQRLREQVADMAREAPLQAMIARSQLDLRGRAEVIVPGLMGSPAEAEEALLQRAYGHAAQFVWPARADLIAGTAVEIVRTEHAPAFEDLIFIAQQSPWVVEGHEEIVLRGLLAGLHGEWLLAAHLLVPQFEASIRSVMERSGLVVARLQDGVEEDRTLGALLDRPESKALLGDDLHFELRGILIEKVGYNFRNRIAHGLLPSEQCYSHPAVLTWWLMLRLCLTTITPPAEAADADP